MGYTIGNNCIVYAVCGCTHKLIFAGQSVAEMTIFGTCVDIGASTVTTLVFKAFNGSGWRLDSFTNTMRERGIVGLQVLGISDTASTIRTSSKMDT